MQLVYKPISIQSYPNHPILPREYWSLSKKTGKRFKTNQSKEQQMSLQEIDKENSSYAICELIQTDTYIN